MMQQLSLFDVGRRPPLVIPVNADGPVLQFEPDFVFRLAHPRMAWARAKIEVHRHTNGLWMWSVGYTCNDGGGGGYRVGEKWGKFADTREDALFYAVQELEGRIAGRDAPEAAIILKWAQSLNDNPEAFS